MKKVAESNTELHGPMNRMNRAIDGGLLGVGFGAPVAAAVRAVVGVVVSLIRPGHDRL